VGEAELFDICIKVVNDYLDKSEHKKVRPVFLRDNVLIFASLSNTATEKVRQNEPKIIARIQDKTGNAKITEIKILT